MALADYDNGQIPFGKTSRRSQSVARVRTSTALTSALPAARVLFGEGQQKP